MEGFRFVTPVTGLSGSNTGKEDDEEVFIAVRIMMIMLYTSSDGDSMHRLNAGICVRIYKASKPRTSSLPKLFVCLA
jgi:hypothetical protein